MDTNLLITSRLSPYYKQFRIAQEISTMIPSNFASTLNVIYFPQLGYLITVPLRPEWTEEEDFQIEGLYYQARIIIIFCSSDHMRGYEILIVGSL